MNLRTTTLALVTAAFAAHGWADGKSDSGQKLRFAQITDVHLFDAGYNCYAPDVDIEQDAAINGLKWAVNKINQENQAAALNFVVITGDLGIANLGYGRIPPRNPPIGGACSQNPSATKELGPVASESIQQAAINFACILRDLNVRSIYLVPGENDVPPDPPGRDSYREFVEALSRALPGRIRDLSRIVDPASDAPWDVVQGYALFEFDNPSFNPSDPDLNKTAPKQSPAGKRAPPPCTNPETVSTISQLSRTAGFAEKTSHPFLLFTHIPDLRDPHEGHQANDKTGKDEVCNFPSILSNPNFVGVFAGHVHSPDASQYGGPFRAVSTPAAAPKIYVAPPISLKNQWSAANPRRGLLIVEVQNTRVEVKIDWYEGIDPTKFQGKAFATDAQRISSAKVLLKSMLPYGIAFLLFVGFWVVHPLFEPGQTSHNPVPGTWPPPEPT